MNKRILGIAPWVLLNILAMIAYLYFASAIWAPKGEKGLLGGPGDPILWVFTAFPFMVAGTLLNLVWLILIFRRRRSEKNWYPIIAWLVVIAAWYGAKLYDGSRHFTGAAVVRTSPTDK